MRSLLSRIYKVVAPVAYLALIFAACVKNYPLAVPFFSFLAPFGVVVSVMIFLCVALVGFLRVVDREANRPMAQKWLSEIDEVPCWLKFYMLTCGGAEIVMLIGTLHPVYAAFSLGSLLANAVLRRILASF